jgi:hypothetical protein
MVLLLLLLRLPPRPTLELGVARGEELVHQLLIFNAHLVTSIITPVNNTPMRRALMPNLELDAELTTQRGSTLSI